MCCSVCTEKWPSSIERKLPVFLLNQSRSKFCILCTGMGIIPEYRFLKFVVILCHYCLYYIVKEKQTFTLLFHCSTIQLFGQCSVTLSVRENKLEDESGHPSPVILRSTSLS